MSTEKKTAEEILYTSFPYLREYNIKKSIPLTIEDVIDVIKEALSQSTPPPIQEAGEVTERDFENLIDAHLTPTAMAKDCFELARKMCQAKHREVENLKEEIKIKSNYYEDKLERLHKSYSEEYVKNSNLTEQLSKVNQAGSNVIEQLKSSQVEGEVVYRKVSVKERFPDEMQEIIGITDWGRVVMATLKDNKWHSTDCEKEITEEDIPETVEYITHWLEPITLSQAKQGGYSLWQINKAYLDGAIFRNDTGFIPNEKNWALYIKQNDLQSLSQVQKTMSVGGEECSHPPHERIVDQDKHEYCGRCYKTFE